MANEIQLTHSLRVANGAFQEAISATMAIDQAALGAGGIVQTISHTAAQAISLTGVATNGLTVLQNLDATHYILWGPYEAGAMRTCGKLKPGESFVVRIAPSVVLYAQADTADCQLRTRIYND